MLLIATGLFVGGSAYAEDQTINATLVHTASASWASNLGRDNTLDSEKEYYNTETGSGWAGAAFAEFSATLPEGAIISKVTLKWSALNGNNNADRDNNIYCLNVGQTVDYDDILANNGNAFLFSGVKTFITKISGRGTYVDETDVTNAVKAIYENGQSYVIFQWTGNAGGAELYGKASEDAPVLTIEYLVGASEAELALIDLEKSLETANAKVSGYIVGEGLFQYPTSEMLALTNAIAQAQNVYDTQKDSAEALKAAKAALDNAVETFAPVMNVPDPAQAYILSLKTDAGTFPISIAEGKDNVRIQEVGTPVYFVPKDGGFAITNGTEYVNYLAGGQTWDITGTSEAYGWTIAALDDGTYTINGKNGLFGTNTKDGANANSICYGNKKTSDGFYNWTIAELTEIKVNVTDAGWATLYTTVALDFEGTGLTAYTAKVEENVVKLTEVKDVPANTGVVLKGKDDYTIPVITASKTEKGDLVGSTSNTEYNAEDGYTYYILTTAGENEVQFNPVTSGTIAAGKAYLKLPAGTGTKLRVAIEGEATAISGIATEKVENGATYNVAGQLVDDNYKGIVIKNGKKYLNK